MNHKIVTILQAALCVSSLSSFEKIDEFSYRRVSEKTAQFVMGTGLEAISFLAHAGCMMSYIIPVPSYFRNECQLLSHLSHTAAQPLWAQFFKNSSLHGPRFQGIPLSQHSWHLNQLQLAQIPISSNEDEKLIHFLENRWLAKSTGFFPSIINWVYPCFGIHLQVHPETTSHYARNPWNKLSSVYRKRVEYWKQLLPHPKYFPLILTRPCDLKEYLPSYLTVAPSEKMHLTIERISSKMKTARTKIVVDISDVSEPWNKYQKKVIRHCHKKGLDIKKLLFIHRLQQGDLGGIRLLPLNTSSPRKIQRDTRFLLKWISTFGLSANQIELDRCTSHQHARVLPAIPTCHAETKETLLTYCKTFLAHENVMVSGTVQIIIGLLENMSEILHCKTKSSIAEITFGNIKEELQCLKNDTLSFFEISAHLEQIHASLSTLIEVASPFSTSEFPHIYKSVLKCIPTQLQPLTACGVHSAGMTTIAGVFKALEKSLRAPPRVIYGENTYFECIKIAELLGKSSAIEEAAGDDFEQVDLILAQFNPALKRIDLKPTEYRVEKIEECVHKALNFHNRKPLTLAIDCTLDFLDSPRVENLLSEFENEIKAGILNVICYRSGLKFDLLGMDNYCGAPFYMIHSREEKWSSFDLLVTDPALLTDRLSLNWFCLAYKYAGIPLDEYRKAIFNNTRALLNKIPPRLFDQSSRYRVVHFEKNADPAFIDIKISSPHHALKGPALVAGCLNLKCLQRGHPIFHRPSLGFYHPNFTMLFSKENSTIRLTVGVDPAQVDVLAECFTLIDSLN